VSCCVGYTPATENRSVGGSIPPLGTMISTNLRNPVIPCPHWRWCPRVAPRHVDCPGLFCPCVPLLRADAGQPEQRVGLASDPVDHRTAAQAIIAPMSWTLPLEHGDAQA
jgi:hypothetical protein